jgi:hypothetical protein
VRTPLPSLRILGVDFEDLCIDCLHYLFGFAPLCFFAEYDRTVASFDSCSDGDLAADAVTFYARSLGCNQCVGCGEYDSFGEIISYNSYRVSCSALPGYFTQRFFSGINCNGTLVYEYTETEGSTCESTTTETYPSYYYTATPVDSIGYTSYFCNDTSPTLSTAAAKYYGSYLYAFSNDSTCSTVPYSSEYTAIEKCLPASANGTYALTAAYAFGGTFTLVTANYTDPSCTHAKAGTYNQSIGHSSICDRYNSQSENLVNGNYFSFGTGNGGFVFYSTYSNCLSENAAGVGAAISYQTEVCGLVCQGKIPKVNYMRCTPVKMLACSEALLWLLGHLMLLSFALTRI